MSVVLLIHTCIVAMRGRGCLVLAPPSTAMPSVLTLLDTRTNVGPDSPDYNTQRGRDREKYMNNESVKSTQTPMIYQSCYYTGLLLIQK